MKRSGGSVVLLTLDAFVALTALGGGVALVAGLEEGRFPLEWLRGTPFTSYTLPGLLLAALVGGSAAVAEARAPRCWPAGS